MRKAVRLSIYRVCKNISFAIAAGGIRPALTWVRSPNLTTSSRYQFFFQFCLLIYALAKPVTQLGVTHEIFETTPTNAGETQFHVVSQHSRLRALFGTIQALAHTRVFWYSLILVDHLLHICIWHLKIFTSSCPIGLGFFCLKYTSIMCLVLRQILKWIEMAML